MRPDYGNWVPKSMVLGLYAGALLTACPLLLFLLRKDLLTGTPRMICLIIFALATLVLLFFAVWMHLLHRAFDYNGRRKLSKTIIDGIAEYVRIPDGGTGLDVGCGSGALAIACAKRNPDAHMTGIDMWAGAYKAVFTKTVCERNAAAENVSNVSFQKGNAVALDFPDETFDCVTSNYVYHNIPGKDKQKLLLETLRVLKKGGTFAIHDLMGPARYGDMQAFAAKLRQEGFTDVRLQDTTDGTFMTKKEASFLGLSGSTLLTGTK